MGEKILGNRVKTKIVKNKVAAPFRRCEFDIMYNEGISLPGDLLDVGVEMDVIDKAGNSYRYKGEKLGVGRENAKAALKERKELMKEIRQKCLDKWMEEEHGVAKDGKTADAKADTKKEKGAS